MALFNKVTRKLGIRKLRYGTIHPKMADCITFKCLAAPQKKNYVDFFHELLDVYIDCKQKKHEVTIAPIRLSASSFDCLESNCILGRVFPSWSITGMSTSSPAGTNPSSSLSTVAQDTINKDSTIK